MRCASFNRHLDIVKLLLSDPRIDVNAGDEKGRTALIEASFMDRADVVTLLLAAPGIDVNAKMKDGWTALMAAATAKGTPTPRHPKAPGGGPPPAGLKRPSR